MATVAPYSLNTQVIASNGALLGPGSTQLFVESLQKTYIWLAVINATAIILSLLGGGKRRPDEPKDPPPMVAE